LSRNPEPRRTRSGRAGDLLGGLAALVAIAVLVVGVPAALAVIVGWPLPHAVPSLADLSRALVSGSIPDEFFGKALAVLGWLYWAQFLVCLAAEVTAARRGRVARRIPLGGWNQAIAARLIGALLLLGPAPGPARPVASAAAAARPSPVVATTTLDADDQHAVEQSEARRPAAALPVYVVAPRDTLWGIAERFLGDPYRWRELFQLNQGRPLPHPPGGRFTDPDLIYPGQQLLLPADATGRPATRLPRRPQAPAGTGQRAHPDGQAQPTSTLTPEATRPPPTRATAPPRPGPASTGPPPVTTPLGESADQEPAPAVATALAVGGLLAVGTLAVLARRRRRQQRYRKPGRRIRLPTGTAARIEQRLRAAAEPHTAAFLDAALRAMAAGLQRAGLPPPTVQAVQLGPATLEVLLREPSPTAPPPFAASDQGRRWRLPRQVPVRELEAAAGDAVAPLPALVTIGTSDAGQLLLNLEAAGLIALAGAPTATRPLLDAMAVELATAASSGFVQVLLVGVGAELDRLERVQRVQRLEDALPALERQAREVADLISQRGCGSVLGGRVAGVAADSWAPTVVLAADPPSPASLQRLAEVTSDPRGSTVAAVLVGDTPAAHWRLDVGDQLVRIPTLDLQVHPQRLTDQEYGAIVELLRTASDVDGVDTAAPPYDQVQPPPPAVIAKAAEAATPPAVEVGVLGRVEVRGVPKIQRAKSIELIVYLALHRHGVDGEQLWEALWPDKPINRGTLHTTVTAARTGLGRAPDGSRYLPNAGDGLYRLSPAVSLDWDRFRTLAYAGQAGGPDATGLLHQALELVRGRPLDSPASRSYEWAVVHRTEMETVIAETAERLGMLHLDAGDPEQANWAARRGLAASPYDERLYRLLMRAAHAAGNPAGVETLWQELLAVLGTDLDLVDEDLHPDTVALYTSLRGSRRLRPAQPGRHPAIPQN
jgi:DNA-binding SARP family transcriptional activator/LysM repeat protein